MLSVLFRREPKQIGQREKVQLFCPGVAVCHEIEDQGDLTSILARGNDAGFSQGWIADPARLKAPQCFSPGAQQRGWLPT